MKTTLFIILSSVFFHHQISFSKPVLGEITNTHTIREITNPNENQERKSYVDSSTQTHYFQDPRISPEKLNQINAPIKGFHNTNDSDNIPTRKSATPGKYLRCKGLFEYTVSLALTLAAPNQEVNSTNDGENDLIDDPLTETDPSSDSLDRETDNSENITVISGQLPDYNEKPSRIRKRIDYKCNKNGCKKNWLPVGENQPEYTPENAIPSVNTFTKVTPRSKWQQEARILRNHPYLTPKTKLSNDAMNKRLRRL